MHQMPEKKVICVGITGGIGSGKSTLVSLLKERKIPVMDCDAINRELLLPDAEGYKQIKEQFQDDVWNEDGTLHTGKMSQCIFSDPNKKKKLEQILHPLILKEMNKRLAKWNNCPLVAVEVPLLYEVHWEHFFDEVWVVASDDETRLYRLKQYRNIEEAEARRRMQHQLPLEEKVAKADQVFYNQGGQEELRQQLDEVLKQKGVIL